MTDKPKKPASRKPTPAAKPSAEAALSESGPGSPGSSALPRAKAMPAIVEKAGRYQLPGLFTNGGNPIDSPSRAVIQSIARELAEKGQLDASDFGPYSIFSSYVDFIVGEVFVHIGLINELVDTDHVQNAADCKCIWSQEAPELRKRYLSMCRRIGIEAADRTASSEYRQSLLQHLDALPDHEKAFFALLNGMRGVPISVSLLLLRGDMSIGELHGYLEQAHTTGGQITDPSYRPYEDVAVALIDEFLANMRSAPRGG